MSAIKSMNTQPEVYFRKLLFNQGYRYRIAPKQLPGKPDMYLKKYNCVIFINGCFWHRHHNCQYASTPKSNEAFWQKKFLKNIERDEKVKKQLKEKNIRVLIIWECSIRMMKKNTKKKDEILQKTIEFIHSNDYYLEL